MGHLPSMLRRAPLFSLTVILTLALGIGANTAIFTVVNSVLLRALPYRDPSRLVAIWDTYQPSMPKLGVSTTEYDEWTRQTDLFEDIGRYRHIPNGQEANLTGGSEPRRVEPTCASSSFFSTLGIHAMLGRVFEAADDTPKPPPIALLSYRLWRDYFNSNANLIGAPIQLNGEALTVIGVLPPDFRFPDWADLWLPQGHARDEITNPVRHSFGVIARLGKNVSMREVSARLDSIAKRLEHDQSKTSKGFGRAVSGLQEDLGASIRPALLVLQGAVTLVLLIACLNVANLLLSRSASRRREMAVRIALGAGRWRIIFQSLRESILLSLMGGLTGLFIAFTGLRGLSALAPPGLIDPSAIHIDPTTLAFLFAVSFATGIVFGIAPALQAASQDPNTGLKDGGRSSTAGSGAGRNALVIAEFALALVLLMGAGLLIRSLTRLLHVNPGFQTANVLTLSVHLSSTAYADGQKLETFYERLAARLESLPGVKAVAGTNALPLGGKQANETRFTVPGSPAMRPDVLPVAQLHLITPSYFRTLGIALRGRNYSGRDLNQPVIIINETMARNYWPGQDAVGQRFVIGPWGPNPPWSTVIGIAADVKQAGLNTAPGNDIYYLWYTPEFVMIQTSHDPMSLAQAVRREIQALDPTAPVSDFRTMDQVLEASAGSQRFSTVLLGIFAGLALVLAVIGIYSVMSWSVAQRTQEIGIRMAVGSSETGVFKLILGRGLKLAAIGLAIGLAATLASTRVLSSLLFEISPHDPWLLAAVSFLMILAMLAACYFPARCATKVDPITTLRAE